MMEEPILVGTLVKTRKGANFCGRCVVLFDNLSGYPHAVVEALEPGFEGTLHVYPLGQLVSDEGDDVQSFYADGLKEERPFGADGVSVPVEGGGTTTLSKEDFEQFKRNHGDSEAKK